MRITPQALSQHLAKNIASLYLLHGNESFLLEESATMIRQHIQRLGECEHSVISAAEIDSLATQLEQGSLFAATKIIELKIPKPNAQLMATITDLLEKPLEGCYLIIQTGMITRTQQQAKWFTAIEQKGVTLAHWPLTGAQFVQWIDGRAARIGLNLAPDIRQQLISYTEGNCLAAAQELDRLHLLSGATTYFEAQSQYTLSELCEAALMKQPERVIKIISYLKSSKEALQLVIWTLGQTLRALKACAQAPRDRQTFTLQKAGIRPQLHPIYLKSLQENPSSHRWLSLLMGLSSADKQLKSGDENNAWQKVLDVSLQLAGTPVF